MTNELLCSTFSLASLRGAFSREFAQWDKAVRQGDTVLAAAARASIREIAFRGLSDGAAAMGGFYLFLDPSNQIGLRGLNYVGIADSLGRPIGRRIIDRLRDDNALDVELDKLDPATARTVVYERLVCAMPKTGKNYVAKHLTVAELFRRSPSVILVGCGGPSGLIREAERLLIGSAYLAGAPLFNRQHIRFQGRASANGLELAYEIIRRAADQGLPRAGARAWVEALAKANSDTPKDPGEPLNPKPL